MPDSQIYRFFIDNGPGAEGTLIATVKLEPQLRPQVGDSLTLGPAAEEFRITRDEIPLSAIVFTRITEDGNIRITEDGNNRILEEGATEEDPDNVTHNYFVTRANNPERLVSWTSTRFANDQTLQQLFR